MSAHNPLSEAVVFEPEKDSGLHGSISVPGDKSITHRAILFGGIAEGTTVFRTSILGRDNFASLRIMRQLGAKVSGAVTADLRKIADEEGFAGDLETTSDPLCRISIAGCGSRGISAAQGPLDCGNSGTTARLLTGILAGRPFDSTLVGDSSLSSRPFKRVIEPLGRMGAEFGGERLPLTIKAAVRPLEAISYLSPKASAQVKSAVLLAGLRAAGPTAVIEPHLSRDHTERMFSAMGVKVLSSKTAAGIEAVLPPRESRGELRAIEVDIPGDFSAAAFFLVAGSITPDSAVTLKAVGVNPTRIGLLTILQRMGASIELGSRRLVGGEEVADITVRSSRLSAVSVGSEEVVLAIDEIPILAVACALAEGESVISGAEELRVKESDRLAMTAKILKSFGIDTVELPDGLKIKGRPELAGKLRAAAARKELSGQIKSWTGSGDHRIAMSGAVMQFALSGRFDLYDLGAVETSFPGFVQCFQSLSK